MDRRIIKLTNSSFLDSMSILTGADTAVLLGSVIRWLPCDDDNYRDE